MVTAAGAVHAVEFNIPDSPPSWHSVVPAASRSAQSGCQTCRLLGDFKDWKAIAYKEDDKESGGTVCYMVSQPKKAEPSGKQRGDIHALVTHRPGEKSFDVVSFIAGYTYKSGSDVSVQVDNETYSLFTDGETAWARDEATDHKLADAIKSGYKLVVKGVSSRGTNTTDTYSLSGSGDAYKAIGEACNYKH
ncbi:MAG: hypothetical protein GC191_14475 [Azospirillum sp.]|nr:hypothetical protein [Azospirillum sp.]